MAKLNCSFGGVASEDTNLDVLVCLGLRGFFSFGTVTSPPLTDVAAFSRLVEAFGFLVDVFVVTIVVASGGGGSCGCSFADSI